MKKKSIFCALLCLPLVFGFAACGETGSDDPDSPSGGSKGSINIHYMAGGFSSDSNKLISADYKALTGVTVNWRPSYSQGEIQQLLNSDQEQYDIVMPLLNMYAAQDAGKLECLDDVYDAIPDGAEKPIKERMNQSLYEYFEADDGHRYQMVAQDSVSALCYNMGTLDEAFGAGEWELPRTTKELIDMSYQLKAKGYYAFTTATAINYYWDYLGIVWWAQYEGLESFNNFYEGKYWNEVSSSWEIGPQINDAKGREIALETLSTVMSSKNGLMHARSANMDFKNAQRTFLNNGFVNDKTKVAFMVNGDWLENEMSSALVANPQEIRMMRAPVVSELATKLQSVGTEANLTAIVKAVDEGKSYEEVKTGDLANLTEQDFNRVKEARLMVYTATPNYPVGIPSYRPAAKKQLAKDFLVYLYSDRAQRIIAKELKGLSYPSGYDVLSDDGVQVSKFVESRLTQFGNDKITIFPRNASPLVYRGSLADTPGAGAGIDNSIWSGKTATALLADSKQTISNNWENIVKYLKTDSAD